MNKRDATVIARSLSGAFTSSAFKAQTAATAWYVAIEAVADAIEQCGGDRAAFLAECRAPVPVAEEGEPLLR